MNGAGKTWTEILTQIQAGKVAEALVRCRALVHRQPRFFEAWSLLGRLELQAGRPAEALAALKKAGDLGVKTAEHFVEIGKAQRGLKQTQEAIASFDQALALDPSFVEALHQKGNALRRLGRHQEARIQLARATTLNQQEPCLWLNLGVTQLELEETQEALRSFEMAVGLAPQLPEARNILGVALMQLGRLGEAEQGFREALRQAQTYLPALENLARVLKAQARLEDALPLFRKAAEGATSPGTRHNYLMTLLYMPGLEAAFIEAEHRRLAPKAARVAKPRDGTLPSPGAKQRRLRLGYVSGDLCRHSVAFFLEPVLAHHDPRRFEVHVYSNGLSADSVTHRLRSLCEHWRDVQMLEDGELEARIRADAIDLLVDLSGHSARNRLQVFANRAAPLQLTWLGYPATTGVEAMDYRVTDARCLPEGAPGAAGTERLLRLPRVFSVYQAPSEAPEPGDWKAEGPLTLCSFNNLAKLSQPCLAAWAQILKALPEARLLLKAPGASDPATQRHLRGRFQAEGVAPDRVLFNGDRLGLRQHLSLYRDCALALDTFPYNGTTTTCEALLMGVPVLTLSGDSHVSRVGTSLLGACGLDELIAPEVLTYIQKALALARDLPRLKQYRQTLRGRFLASPICDASGFTAEFEEALLGLVTPRVPSLESEGGKEGATDLASKPAEDKGR